MDQTNKEDREGVSEGAFVFQSRPNRSLTQTQHRLAFWSLAGSCCATAGGFALLGYWPALPFAGLEAGLLAWSFAALRRQDGNYETLTIDGDKVVLEWRTGTHRERREMNRRWACVVCDCGTPGRNCRLSLRSHGRETRIGQYLSDEARLHLAATLRRKLRA